MVYQHKNFFWSQKHIFTTSLTFSKIIFTFDKTTPESNFTKCEYWIFWNRDITKYRFSLFSSFSNFCPEDNNGGDLFLNLTRPVASVRTANATKSDRFALGRFYVKLPAIILELCVSGNFQHVWTIFATGSNWVMQSFLLTQPNCHIGIRIALALI